MTSLKDWIFVNYAMIKQAGGDHISMTAEQHEDYMAALEAEKASAGPVPGQPANSVMLGDLPIRLVEGNG